MLLKENNKEKVRGYYTLSSAHVCSDAAPATIKKNFPPSYTQLPVILMGRLAVDQTLFGKGIGSMLLIEALKRCHHLSNEIGSFALVVDPLYEEATRFYEKYGFILLPDSGQMLISMATIKQLF